jgi:hypothetical protein
VQVVSIDEDTTLLQQYGASVPRVFVEVGGGWQELRRQAPRLTADALALRIENEVLKLAAAQQDGGRDSSSEKERFS